ncbi:MAG: CDP-alcohol phosphatidyltransferase family protein [Sulfurovaceae bacterium]|nr:CDP-alcohol phosphatidyltransferase family protein [Sulfurovaceae bacterium]
MKLFEPNYHFNLANLITFANITCGMVAIYLVTQHQFVIAAVLAWCAGAFDIMDGKVARKYGLSTEFGVQLDSFADFLSFVVMPSFFLFFALEFDDNFSKLIVGFIFIWYVISGLRRLVSFNLANDAGEVTKYFTGVPTPLGAILLWILWLLYIGGVITSILAVSILVLIIAWSLNSKVKIPHL